MTFVGVRARIAAPLFLFTVGLVAAAGCQGDSTTAAESTTPTAVLLTSGDTQTVFTDSMPLLPFTVLVVNQNGTPLYGIPITWSLASGSGTLNNGVTTTNPDGHGLVAFTAPHQPGASVIDATVAGLPPVVFHISVVSSPSLDAVGSRH